MAEGTSQAFPMRSFLAVFALSLLVVTGMASVSQAGAQTPEGTVRIVPGMSSVEADQGPFTIYVVLEDLNHYGTLMYDDDRDTVPDRQVESTGLAAFEFTIQYDQAVLEVAGVEQGPNLDSTGRTFQCLPPAEKPGSLRFGCLSPGPEPPGAQGTLTLASVTLSPIGSGSSPLLLETELAGPLGSDEVPVIVKGGVVRVTGRPVATAAPTSAGTEPGSTGSPSVIAPLDTPAGVLTDRTPTPRTAAGDGRTPASATAPAAVAGADPHNPAAQGKDSEAQNEDSGGSPGRAVLWAAGAAGGLVAAITLGLAAVLWRRRTHLGGA